MSATTGREHPESGLLQNRRTIAEECEDAGGVGHLLAGSRRGQRRAEGGDEPSGTAQASEKMLVGVRHVALQGGELGTVGPYRCGSDEQARIVYRLQRELDQPLVDGIGVGGRMAPTGTPATTVSLDGAVFGGALGRNNPEIGPYRFRIRVLRGVPSLELLGQ